MMEQELGEVADRHCVEEGRFPHVPHRDNPLHLYCLR